MQQQFFCCFLIDASFIVQIIFVYCHGCRFQAKGSYCLTNSIFHFQKEIITVLRTFSQFQNDIFFLTAYFFIKVARLMHIFHQLTNHFCGGFACEVLIVRCNSSAIIVNTFQLQNQAIFVIFNFNLRIHAQKDRPCSQRSCFCWCRCAAACSCKCHAQDHCCCQHIFMFPFKVCFHIDRSFYFLVFVCFHLQNTQ